MTALFIGGLSFIPMDSGTAGVLGFLVLIPLSMAALVAVFVGIGYTLRLYHHWPLVAISLLSVLLMAEVVTEYGSVMFYNASPIFYGAITSAFSLVWFVVYRKQWGNEG
ncbi:MAG: hypothetical protein ACE5F3_03005 [Mariprofundaceae bacterium]